MRRPAVSRGELLWFDTEPALPLRAGLSNDDFHVTAKCRQQAHESLDGILPKISPQEAGYVRLGQSKQFRRLDLLEPTLANDLVNAGDEFCL